MNRILVFAIILLSSLSMAFGHSSPVNTPPSHAVWDALLKKYVTAEGKVNYKGLRNEKSKLNAYLATLASTPPQDNWAPKEEMAYWINAYNAFTVQLILEKYPVKSIRNLHDGNPWDVKWIKIGDKIYSLNNIEHDILRPKFKDARIHFAVNCAAKSCPPLANKAWTASSLNIMLEQQTQAFINNPKYNKITPNSTQLSKIFEWYKEDFGELISYLNKYSKTRIVPNAQVAFLEYDWALNDN